MASKRHQRFKKCQRKHRYATAKEASVEKARKRLDQGITLNVYRCSFCNGYHLGHPPVRYQG